jgi:hypothetical protein
MGLSSAASSTIIAGRATSYADRRRAAAERLSKVADIARGLDDVDGTLRASVRALVPLASRTDGFDVTVSLGPDHRWAARIRRDGDGVTAELVAGAGATGAPRAAGATGAAAEVAPAGPQSSEARIAAELATLLWNGEVRTR